MASMTEVPRVMNQTNELIVKVSPLVLPGARLGGAKSMSIMETIFGGYNSSEVVMMRENFDAECKQQGVEPGWVDLD